MRMGSWRLASTGLAVAALVVAATGLSWAADRAAAEKQLKDAIKAGNAEGIQKACDALIEVGGKDALNVVLGLAPTVEGSVYWQLTGAAAGFQDRPALESLGQFIVQHQNDAKVSLSRDLLFQLQNNTSAYVAVPVGFVLEKGKYDLQLMAVDQLAVTRSVESIDALVKVNKVEKDPELHRRIEHALESLCGTQNADANAWDSWWQQQRSKGVPEKKAAGGAGGPGEGGGGGGTIDKPRDAEFAHTVERGDKERVIVISSDRTGQPDGGKTQGNMVYADPWEFDKMERILEGQKIPHTVVKKDDFEKDPKKYLSKAYTVLVNCARIGALCTCPKCAEAVNTSVKEGRANRCPDNCPQGHTQTIHRMKKETLDALKKWVEEDGGYLYTEDLGIVEITEQLWPDYIVSGATEVDKSLGYEKYNSVRQKDANGQWKEHIIVKLTPSRGNTSHPLMRGVWQRPRKEEPKAEPAAGEPGHSTERVESPAKALEHVWAVDDEGPAIEIKNKEKVIPLLESEELAKIDGGFNAVAVTFKPGANSKKQATGVAGGKGTGEWAATKGGRVLHTMSHFGHQSTSEDGRALENLIVNFLLEGAKAHEGGAKK